MSPTGGVGMICFRYCWEEPILRQEEKHLVPTYSIKMITMRNHTITNQKARNNTIIDNNLFIELPRLITITLLKTTKREDLTLTMLRGIRVMSITGNLRWARTC